jgi:DNA-3-methyladenine glycosylase II
METYSASNFKRHCNALRKEHAAIATIHNTYGYPPFWSRGNHFEAMAKTIIEQQVSLASANACVARLREHIPVFTAPDWLKLSDDVVRACGITKQKTHYLRLLAEREIEEPNFFSSLERLSNEAAKEKLMALKGIGHWSANIFLLDALNRVDVYPDFDVALINSVAREAFEGEKINNDQTREYIAQFAPRRSIACLYFYHAYIVRKNISFIP